MDVRVTSIEGTHDEIDSLIIAAELRGDWPDLVDYTILRATGLRTRLILISFGHLKLQAWNRLCDLAMMMGAHDVKNN